MPRKPKAHKTDSRSTRSRGRAPLQKAKPSVSIIGVGRVGTALGLALKAASYRVELVVAKHPASARSAAQLLGGDTEGISEARLNRPSATQMDSLNRSSLIIIATPDDTIGRVA